MYKVTSKAFHMDDKPQVFTFDEWYEAEEWIQEELESRVSWRITHTPYMISEEDIPKIEEEEASLIQVERI